MIEDINRLFVKGVFLVAMLILVGGCAELPESFSEDYLVKVNPGFVVTVADFNRDLELEKIACADEFMNDKDELNALKIRLLNRTIEELVILKTARENGVHVSSQELDGAVAQVTSDYPEGEFEIVLLENAVTLEQWKKKLNNRLVIDKTIDLFLKKQMKIDPDELAFFYKEFFPEGIPDSSASQEDLNRLLIEQLRDNKAAEAYKDWVSKLWEQSDVDINSTAWESIIKS